MKATVPRGPSANGYIHNPSRVNGERPQAMIHAKVTRPRTVSVAITIQRPTVAARGLRRL